LESITQSVLCLMKVENEVIWTPKPILIKEAELLIKNFSSDRYVGLVYSVLVNVLA
jgi:transcription termination factor NusB